MIHKSKFASSFSQPFFGLDQIPKYSSVLPIINKPESPDISAAPKPIIHKIL